MCYADLTGMGGRRLFFFCFLDRDGDLGLLFFFLLVFLFPKCYNRFKEILSTGTAGTVLPLSIIK